VTGRPPRRLPAWRVPALAGTIRGRILIAFLVMTAITGTLGIYSSYLIHNGGQLVTITYDRSLMAINYARAASADFAMLQVTAERAEHAPDPRTRAEAEALLAELRRSLAEDLSIAAERSQSPRAERAAERARSAVEAWDAAVQSNGVGAQANEAALAAYVAAANQDMDLLINYTAGDGFDYRQSARAAVEQNLWLNLSGLLAAASLSAVVAWLLARNIISRVAAASDVAGRIAQGQLDGSVPEGGPDELGALLASLAIMRDNLRAMMAREVSQRQSAQARLLDAMESSHEGIVVVDRDGSVILANQQALSALEWTDRADAIQSGRPIAGMSWALLSGSLPTPDAQGNVEMPSGRWVNISRSTTREGGFIAVMTDITEMKEQAERLAATNLRLDTALDNMSHGLCLFDAEGRLSVVNARYLEIFNLPPGSVRPGITIQELIGIRVAHGNHPGDSVEELVFQKMARVRRRGPTSFTMPIANQRVLSVSLRPAPNGGWAATYEDVTERRLAEEQVAFMARHDALTRLPNRTLFAERMQQAVEQLDSDFSFAVLCLDLDRFKEVNDTWGHAIGDELLRAVSERLRGCVRSTDTICRLGGDEFAVILTTPSSRDEMVAFARRIIEVSSRPYNLDGCQATVGVSVGIAVAPTDGRNADMLIRNADTALYRAKSDGRGSWRFFEPEMDARVRARRALGQDLQQALTRGEFELRYQPVFDLKRERICGFEALLSWRHPMVGSVPPSEFIPLAEELGFIVILGKWVLEQACLEATRWPDDVTVAVNVSSAQFRDDQLVKTVTHALMSSGLPAARLNIEITETVLLSQSPVTLATMQALRGMGVSISLDDFGTGYSSLSYLSNFPIDQIKIDQSFIRNLAESGSMAIVRSIIGLAKNLELTVVAEGVETVEQLQWLINERCDEVQGFLLARPLSPLQLPAMLDRPWPYAEGGKPLANDRIEVAEPSGLALQT
jgi:diguanylate cyclase (GGDEF)-like protein